MKKKTLHIILNLTLIIYLFSGLPLPNNIFRTYPNIVQAATTVNATFCLVDEAAAWAAYPNVDESVIRKIGTGTVNYTGLIVDNPTAVNKAIVSGPTNVPITWTHLGRYKGTYYVAARLTKETQKYVNASNTSNTISVVSGSPASAVITDKNTTTIPKNTTNAVIKNASKSNNNSKTASNSNKEGKTYTLNRHQILEAYTNAYTKSSNPYSSNDTIKWDGYKKYKDDVADGSVPASLLGDPVYMSMNLPSETVSDFMKKSGRDNGHITGNTSNSSDTQLLAIGSIYPTSGATLPDTMNICLGKIKIFGYNKNTGEWETIKSDARVAGAQAYTLPWETTKNYDIPIKKYNDHIELTVTKKDLTDGCIHFWGTRANFDKSKYSYFVTAYDFWAEGTYTNDCLTAVNAIDVKQPGSNETVSQLNSSRGVSVAKYRKTIWSTTIPNSEYQAEWGTQIRKLYAQ